MIRLLASFDSKEDWLNAFDLFKGDPLLETSLAPFEVEENLPETRALEPLHIFAFVGGMIGVVTGLAMQVWMSVISTPLDVGGRPLFSWPAFIPVCFVLGILFAGLGLTLGLFLRLKLPWPYHPVFTAKNYDISKFRFYLLFKLPERAKVGELTARLPNTCRIEELPE